MENLAAENVSVAGLPKHNKFCETVFGYFDRQLRTTPALSTLTIEAQAMFVFNKTGEWLAAKDDAERSAIIAQSRKDAPTIKAIYKVCYPKVTVHPKIKFGMSAQFLVAGAQLFADLFIFWSVGLSVQPSIPPSVTLELETRKKRSFDAVVVIEYVCVCVVLYGRKLR